MPTDHEEVKRELSEAGVAESQHPRGLQVLRRLEALGLQRGALLDAVRKWGPMALDVIEDVLGKRKGQQDPPEKV